MPSILANARNFKLNTDYPLDKVIYMSSGSMAASGGSSLTTVPHSLGFAPLIVVSWSNTAGFSEAYEATSALIQSSPYAGTYVYATAYSDRIELNCISPTFTTLYYRAYAFMPSDVNVPLDATSQLADTFVFSTDASTAKLYIQGVTTASTSQTTNTVTHSLGYKPQVLAWEDRNGQIIPINFANFAVDDASANVGTSSVVLKTSDNAVTTTSRRVHYRIYADD